MTNPANFDLSGKLALVTGCRRGIGRAMTESLAAAGADIIGASVSMEQKGSAVGEAVAKLGRKFRPYRCDFANRSAVQDLVEQIVAEGPVPDILVNNAGTIRREAAAEHPDEWWDEVIEVNLTSQFILSRGIGREMIKRGSGKIIFTASLLTFQGGIRVPGYSVSKGGIGQLTKALANEWAGSGVNVNAIAPGYIVTDNTEALHSDPERYLAILERIPAGRWGRPEDFAGPAVFLGCSASDYIDGEILTVDGGWMGR
ncbi:MAG: SDR family oxidoreductase [Rhodobacteraceae bacterium]|nr:SDR family oxidoreductase [Paracoccaceae bacterium]